MSDSNTHCTTINRSEGILGSDNNENGDVEIQAQSDDCAIQTKRPADSTINKRQKRCKESGEKSSSSVPTKSTNGDHKAGIIQEMPPYLKTSADGRICTCLPSILSVLC
jgi:hypothetical protein